MCFNWWLRFIATQLKWMSKQRLLDLQRRREMLKRWDERVQRVVDDRELSLDAQSVAPHVTDTRSCFLRWSHAALVSV